MYWTTCEIISDFTCLDTNQSHNQSKLIPLGGINVLLLSKHFKFLIYIHIQHFFFFKQPLVPREKHFYEKIF